MDDRLTKYFLGYLGQQETSELFQQLKSERSLYDEFICIQNTLSLAHLSQMSAGDEEAGKKSFSDFVNKLRLKKQRRTIRFALQYAAAGLILVASTFFLTRYFSLNSNETNTLYVPAGQRAQLTLHDGTQVWLNAQSTLTYPARFSGKQREVSVVGEAYFDVAENPRRPFVVNTQQLTMEVMGTEFNVYSYPESGFTQTSLVEGSLRVSETVKKGQPVLLSPNQQVTYSGDKIKLEKLNNPEHLLWRKGIYAFDNERLIDIIAKLELYYDINILVEDPEIFNVRYTGKFRQRDGIDEILHILQKIQSFKIQKDRERNIITLSR